MGASVPASRRLRKLSNHMRKFENLAKFPILQVKQVADLLENCPIFDTTTNVGICSGMSVNLQLRLPEISHGVIPMACGATSYITNTLEGFPRLHYVSFCIHERSPDVFLGTHHGTHWRLYSARPHSKHPVESILYIVTWSHIFFWMRK